MLEKFTLIGIGGCGCNIASRVVQSSSMNAICIDTDALSLEQVPDSCTKLLVGDDRFDGLGSAGDIGSAKMAAMTMTPSFRQQLKDSALAIVITGLGGGTGSSITPILLDVAKELSIPTMVFAVLPFSMEGTEKKKISNIALNNISNSADIYCYLKNDDFSGMATAEADCSLLQVMESSTEQIVSGITMFWRLFTKPGYINLDLATLISCTKKGHGQFYFSTATVYGEYRTQTAFSQLCGQNSVITKHANEIACAIVGVAGGEDLRLSEIDDTVKNLSMRLSLSSNIKLGTIVDNSLTGSLEITTLLFKNWVEQYADLSGNSTNQHPEASTISTYTQPAAKSKGYQQSITGRLTGTTPFIYNGENLDEPTYIRKRITIS